MTNTTTTAPRVWAKNGSRDRIIRNCYAYRVMIALMGKAACPNCEATFIAGDFDVDRTTGSRRNDRGIELYTQGEIVYLCKACNQSRSLLQNTGTDWPHAEQYAADVREASARVSIPSEREARDWWETRPTVAAKTGRYSA